MNSQSINIVHFHNGSGGGVLSVITNLLRYSENKQIINHVIFTINKNVNSSYIVPYLPGAASIQIFYYSPNWNFYHSCKQLAALLPDGKTLLVAHDWLELGMVSNLGLHHPVVQLLHGDYDYYYELAKKHRNAVDKFITVADSIAKKLRVIIPQRQQDISYLRFPVPENACSAKKCSEYSIVFVGRCTKEKGYDLLPGIAVSLTDMEVLLKWHIVGEPNESMKLFPWDNRINVTFHGSLKNEAVNELLCGMHFFILPSLAEGMPVTLIEAMKAGVIPLVNDLPGGIQELVINDDSGYRIKDNLLTGYAEKIRLMFDNPVMIERMQNNCKDKANKLFDPLYNTSAYESIFFDTANAPKRNKSPMKIYGSRLDHPWIPNLITSFLRKY